MATSTLTYDWLGRGTHAARPAVAPVGTLGTAIYYETDTLSTFIWTGSAWSQINSGSVGTPPSIVQSGSSNAGLASVTLGGAPANGNGLVAMCFNPSTDVAAAGWTRQIDNGTGTDYGTIMTKTCGAGESATQSPLNVSPGGTGAIAMWELSGQATNFFVAGASQAEQSLLQNLSPQLPTISSMLCLMACSLADASITIAAAYNFTQDQLINTGTRKIVAGHCTASLALGQLLTVFSSGAPSSKSAICLVTS